MNHATIENVLVCRNENDYVIVSPKTVELLKPFGYHEASEEEMQRIYGREISKNNDFLERIKL